MKFAYPYRQWRSPLTLSELPFRLWGSLHQYSLPDFVNYVSCKVVQTNTRHTVLRQQSWSDMLSLFTSSSQFTCECNNEIIIEISLWIYRSYRTICGTFNGSRWACMNACLGGAVGSVAVRAAWLRWSASLGSRPKLAGSLCQVIAEYALRLNSRACSTVSSLICDRWLILGLETLSISRCLNHW